MTAETLARTQFTFTVLLQISFPAFSIGLAGSLAALNGPRPATRDRVWPTLFDYSRTYFKVALAMSAILDIKRDGTDHRAMVDVRRQGVEESKWRRGRVIAPLLAHLRRRRRDGDPPLVHRAGKPVVDIGAGLKAACRRAETLHADRRARTGAVVEPLDLACVTPQAFNNITSAGAAF